MWATDAEGIITTANEATVLVTGRALESMVGMPALELFRPDEDLRKTDRHLLALSYWLMRHPGVKRPIDGYIKALDGRVVRVHAMMHCSVHRGGWVVEAELVDDIEIARLRQQFPQQFADPFERLDFARWHADHRPEPSARPRVADRKPRANTGPRHHRDLQTFWPQLQEAVRKHSQREWDFTAEKIGGELHPPISRHTLGITLAFHHLLIDNSIKKTLIKIADELPPASALHRRLQHCSPVQPCWR